MNFEKPGVPNDGKKIAEEERESFGRKETLEQLEQISVEAAKAAENIRAVSSTRDNISQKDNKSESFTELTTQEVKTKKEFREVLTMLKTIFTDPADLATDMEFARMFFSPDLARFYLIHDKGKPVGMELIMINPESSAMYVPYAGLATDYRNLGIYPKAAAIHDEQMRLLGKDHVLYEFEDPNRIVDAEAYPDEDPDDVTKRCEARINFWRRSVGCLVVNDKDVPYCRPASDDSKEIQAYDVLAFRVLDRNDSEWKDVFNEDGTAISREAYERFYLEIMQLEYGMLPKEELRKEYPAIDKFFLQLESHPEKEWISLYSSPVRQKATADPNVDVGIGPLDNPDQRITGYRAKLRENKK